MDIILDIKRINENIFHFLQLVNKLPEETNWMIEVLFSGSASDGMWDTSIDLRESALSKKLVIVGGMGASDGFNRMYFNTDTKRHHLEYHRKDHESVMQADRIRSHFPENYSLELKYIKIDCIDQDECNMIDKLFRAYVCPTTRMHQAFYSVTWMSDNSWNNAIQREESPYRGMIPIRIKDLMVGPVVAHIAFNLNEADYKRIMRGNTGHQSEAVAIISAILMYATETKLVDYNGYNYNRANLSPCIVAFLNDNIPPVKSSLLWSNLENGTKLRLLKDLFVVTNFDELKDLQYQNFTKEQLSEVIGLNHPKDRIFTWNVETHEVIGESEMGQDENSLVDEELWEILNADSSVLSDNTD
jgi:hypothetical protein